MRAAGRNRINAATPIPLGNIPTAAPSYTNNEAAVASVDYTISDRDNLPGRFILNRSGSIDTSGFPRIGNGSRAVSASDLNPSPPVPIR